MQYRTDKLRSLSVRNAAFALRMTETDYLALEAAEDKLRADDAEADLRAQRAWNAQRDAFVAASDWFSVLRMDTH